MDFSFSDEQLAMAELARKIFGDHATQDRLKEVEAGDGPRFDPQLWSALAEAGVLGIAIPEEFGGSGLGFMELALVLEELGRTTAPVPFLETAVLAALPLCEFGSPEQKKAYLPRVAEGETVLTAALVEAGAELTQPTTQATADGEGWVLDGTKICVPAAQIAERVLVPASTTEGEIGIFLIDPTASGVRVIPLDTTSAQPEADLELRGVRVSAADLVGDLASGARILEWIVERGTAALCALAIGVAERALELTAEYTKGREQFGQAIATFQAVGQRAADAYVDTEGIRLTAWQACWRIASGLPAKSQIAVAKYWAAEGGQRIVHTAQHLHGGMGVDRDYPLHRCFTYAKQLELSLGGSTQQLLKLGKLLADEAA